MEDSKIGQYVSSNCVSVDRRWGKTKSVEKGNLSWMRELEREKWETKREGMQRENSKGAQRNQGERVNCTNREIGTAGFASFRYSLFESDTESISHEIKCEFRFSITYESLHLCRRLNIILPIFENLFWTGNFPLRDGLQIPNRLKAFHFQKYCTFEIYNVQVSKI